MAIEKPTHKRPPSPCSSLFIHCLEQGGGAIVECECGVTHFVDNEITQSYYDEGELEPLRIELKQSPKKYRAHYDPEIDSLTYAELNDRKFVLCCSCNWLRPYEDFIWNKRELIAEYLQDRCARGLDEAQRDMELAGVIEVSNATYDKLASEVLTLRAFINMNADKLGGEHPYGKDGKGAQR